MKATIICLGLYLLACQSALGQEPFVLPPDIQATTDQAMEYAKAAIIEIDKPDDVAKIHAAYASFASTMDQLGAQVGAGLAQQMSRLEDQDIRAKLITIAWHRRMHPELYAEIERQYLRRVQSPFAEFPSSPNLRPEHMVERYRLVWEYFLLVPPPAGASGLNEIRAMDALDQIHNTASVETLLSCFLLTTRESVHVGSAGPLNSRQQQLLTMIASYHNEQGLRALLTCGVQAVKQQSHQPETDRWDVVASIHNLLYPEENAVAAVEWRDFLAHYPKERLSEEQRQFLARAAP